MAHKPSKIMSCNCIHKFQDEKYGKQKRVFNWGPMANNRNPGYRCTICKSTKPE